MKRYSYSSSLISSHKLVHISLYSFIFIVLLCLSACGDDSKYLKISNSVAMVSTDDIRDLNEKKKAHEDILQKLKNSKKPFHTLVLNGQRGSDNLVSQLAPIADNVKELIIAGECRRLSNLSVYKNLEVLQVGSFDFRNDEEVKGAIDNLTACPKLRELTIRRPGGQYYYALSRGIKAGGLIQTINGKPIADWTPETELNNTLQKYHFTAGVISDMLKPELESYKEYSTPPPHIRGKILLAEKENSGPIKFVFRHGDKKIAGTKISFAESYYATTASECAAIVVMHVSYEQFGTYTDGSIGFSGRFSVQVIDPVHKIKYAPAPFLTVIPRLTKQARTGSGRESPDYDFDKFVELLKTMVTPS
ncbi:MAG: hypothetical protein DELT_02240 [Desulfovibrio sp.]